MKVFFGYLFLITAGLLSIIQAAIFAMSLNMSGGRLFILFIVTIGSTIGASLALSVDENKMVRKVAAALALLMCIGLVARVAYLVLFSDGTISGGESTLLVIYAAAFGIYGFNGFSV